MDAARTQTRFQSWENTTVAFRGRVTGQGSGSVVPPAEKFFLGGPEFDRGYSAGQVTGDSALAYTAKPQPPSALALAAAVRYRRRCMPPNSA